MSLVSRETSRFVDKYDVTLDVCLPSIFSQSKFLTPHVSRTIIVSSSLSPYLLNCILNLFKLGILCVRQQVGEPIDVCVEDETTRYLNRKDVQHALNARLVKVDSWTVCSKYCFLIIYTSSLTDILLTKKVSIFCFYHILSLFGK